MLNKSHIVVTVVCFCLFNCDQKSTIKYLDQDIVNKILLHDHNCRDSTKTIRVYDINYKPQSEMLKWVRESPKDELDYFNISIDPKTCFEITERKTNTQCRISQVIYSKKTNKYGICMDCYAGCIGQKLGFVFKVNEDDDLVFIVDGMNME